MGFNELCQHLEAVRRLLASMQGTECFAQASAMQATVLRGMIRQARLSVEESGELADVLRTVPWCDPDRNSLLSFMAEVAAPSGAAGRRNQQ